MPLNLATTSHVTFIPITDKAKALAFYRDLLGLTFVIDQSPFALVFELKDGDLQGTMLRLTFAAGFKPQPFTILGWTVPDIASYVTDLTAAGVPFNRYPWMEDAMGLAPDALPIWTAPGGAQIAWFQDPFDNVLSLQQNP